MQKMKDLELRYHSLLESVQSDRKPKAWRDDPSRDDAMNNKKVPFATT